MSDEHNFDDLKNMMNKVPQEEREALMEKMRSEIKAASIEEVDGRTKHILIVDNLGVITFQLEKMFAKYNLDSSYKQSSDNSVTLRYEDEIFSVNSDIVISCRLQSRRA